MYHTWHMFFVFAMLSSQSSRYVDSWNQYKLTNEWSLSALSMSLRSLHPSKNEHRMILSLWKAFFPSRMDLTLTLGSQIWSFVWNHFKGCHVKDAYWWTHFVGKLLWDTFCFDALLENISGEFTSIDDAWREVCPDKPGLDDQRYQQKMSLAESRKDFSDN